MPNDNFLTAIADIKRIETKSLKIDIVGDGPTLVKVIGYRAGKGYNPVLAIKAEETDIRHIVSFDDEERPVGDVSEAVASVKYALVSVWPS